MSDIRVFAKNAPGAAGDGTVVGAHGTLYGDLFTADSFQGLVVAGKVFSATWGSVTTPLATPATTAIAAKRPQAWITVPDGKVIIPIAVHIIVESAGATTQGEIAVATTQNSLGAGTSTVGPTPVNLNAAVTGAGSCTTYSLATADTAAEVGLIELRRFSFAASAVNQDFTWAAKQEGVYPILRGAATLAAYIGGNAVGFYMNVVWVEDTETVFTA